jgi:hypothetical protein
MNSLPILVAVLGVDVLAGKSDGTVSQVYMSSPEQKFFKGSLVESVESASEHSRLCQREPGGVVCDVGL